MIDLPLEGPLMDDDLIAEFLAAIPLPALLVDQSERIIAANAEALTLLGQQITGRHFATILRQPQVLDAIEAAPAARGFVFLFFLCASTAVVERPWNCVSPGIPSRNRMSGAEGLHAIFRVLLAPSRNAHMEKHNIYPWETRGKQGILES